MRVAVPYMSGFILYLISVWGLTKVSARTKYRILNVRYTSTLLLVFGVATLMAVSPTRDNSVNLQDNIKKTGPDDGPNQPVGKGTGIFPGRVVWIWDPKATNEDCINSFDLHKPENTNQGVVNRMVVDGIKGLSGKTNLNQAWDALFRSFNLKKRSSDRGYTQGEKIFIKINYHI